MTQLKTLTVEGVDIDVAYFNRAWHIEANQLHTLLHDKFSPLMAHGHGFYELHKNQWWFAIKRINSLILKMDKPSLFSIWFKNHTYDEIVSIITGHKQKSVEPVGIHKRAVNMLGKEHFVLNINKQPICAMIDSTGESFVNLRDFCDLIDCDSSNFLRKNRNYMMQPFDRYINPAFRQTTNYVSIRLLANLKYKYPILEKLTEDLWIESVKLHPIAYPKSKPKFLTIEIQDKIKRGYLLPPLIQPKKQNPFVAPVEDFDAPMVQPTIKTKPMDLPPMPTLNLRVSDAISITEEID